MLTVAELRQEVLYANKMLPASGLVTMHSGNASGYDARSNTLLIKPSGVDYERLTAEALVMVDVLSGTVVGGSRLRPSVDLPHHLFLYRQFPELGGIVHTHSNYATAFAAVGKPIPLVLTAIADEFGGEIPCTPYVDNEDDNIGQAIVKYKTQAPAILLGNHGVFTWGDSPRAALKAAIMTEDVAKTIWLAKQLGTPLVISEDEAMKWHVTATKTGTVRGSHVQFVRARGLDMQAPFLPARRRPGYLGGTATASPRMGATAHSWRCTSEPISQSLDVRFTNCGWGGGPGHRRLGGGSAKDRIDKDFKPTRTRPSLPSCWA